MVIGLANAPSGIEPSSGAAALEAAADELVERGRVARLDAVDRQRGGEDLLALDPPGLAEVGRGAEVLDRRRGLRGSSSGPSSMTASNLAFGLGGRLAAELLDRRGERVDVLLLGLADLLGEVADRRGP